ncbi:hypothetical protein BJV74DRAFT_952915 [Russula compacta]|nr:hypothetical protein BJV74DRAFT_952915 [Russula compacta]
MTTAATPPLPPYPSFHARSQLSHTQLASLNQKISLSIQQTLHLPSQALNPTISAPFVSSYVRDVAQHNLDTLIWDIDSSRAKPRPETTEARTIRARTLLLAERLASTGVLDLTTLLDLSIAYASHPARLRALFIDAFSSSPSLATTTTTSALPAFTSVLLSHNTTGLHGLRKAAHAILCLLRVGPPELLRAFAHSKDFILALAQSYDAGLGAAASSYGRLYLPVAGAPQREPDDWEILFLQTKADLLDAFHILFTALLKHVDPPSLVAKAKDTLDVVSALHALPGPSKRPDDHTPPTPFLNRSLLADYQHAYDLSEVLTRALPHAAAADDARLKRLTAALHDLDADLDRSGPSAAGQARNQDPGAFRLLLGPDVHLGGATRISESAIAIPSGEVEAAATASGSTAADPRVQEVRAILPDYTPEYVEALLQHTEYGSVERVVEALLEGTAPLPEALQQQQQQVTLKARVPQAPKEFEYTRDRRNVFDAEEMDVSRLRMGKKSDDAMTVLRDRSFIGKMKADILRRVEAAPTDSEDEEVNIFGIASDHHVKGNGKSRVREVTFDDELEDVGSVRVVGDGEETSADEEDEDEGEEEPDLTPQTIVELAYIANPKVFERDAATRRSKERAALRAQTGWVDEQIEGFRIILDRDPKMKEKMLARHEFSGNRSLNAGTGLSSGLGSTSRSRSRSGTPDVPSARGRREGGRGGRRGQGNRGHGRGRGRGRGRGAMPAAAGSESGTGTGGGGGDAQSRARKDKNKARQANHDRKRGHDRKMGKAGAPSS